MLPLILDEGQRKYADWKKYAKPKVLALPLKLSYKINVLFKENKNIDMHIWTMESSLSVSNWQRECYQRECMYFNIGVICDSLIKIRQPTPVL